VDQFSVLNRPRCSTVPVTQRVQSALRSWPAECALLQRSATALWEALLCHAPEYLLHGAERRKIDESRKVLKMKQAKAGLRMAQELKAVTAGFSEELRDKRGLEWPALAQLTQAALVNVKQMTTGFLADNEGALATAQSEHEALSKREAICDAGLKDARQQVRRHEQGFKQATDRFAEFGDQILAWARALVPKLRLLSQHSTALRTMADLKKELPALESKKLTAEDELDMVVMELRKHRRHMHGSWAQRSIKAPEQEVEHSTMIESQLELRKRRLEDHVKQLELALREAEQGLAAAVSEVPLAVELAHEAGEGRALSPAKTSLAMDQVVRTQEVPDADSPMLDPARTSVQALRR